MRWARWIRTLPLRVRDLVLRRQAERDLNDEIAFHLEMRALENRRNGLSEAEARTQAKRRFEGVEQSKERCRDARAFRWLDDLERDVHYALCTFRRNPSFVAVAVLVLAVGIGANTTIFTLLDGLLFRPLPVPSPSEVRFVHTMWTAHPNRGGEAAVIGPDRIPQAVPYSTFRYLALHSNVFSGVAQSQEDDATFGSAIQPARVTGERVSTNYFDALQVRPALGRTFGPSDDANPVLVVSDRFWRQNLGADRNVIGSHVQLGARSFHIPFYSAHRCTYTVVGVMPPGFHGIADWRGQADFWAPIRQRAADRLDQRREDDGTGGSTRVEDEMDATIVARLKPGTSDRDATPAVLAASQFLREQDADDPVRRRQRRTLLYGGDTAARIVRHNYGAVPERLALALMLVSTMVLLIAAANLAGIVMARGVARRAEIATRLALGAARGRVARQLLTESLLLSLAGSVGAVLIAWLCIALFTTYLPAEIAAPLYAFFASAQTGVSINLRVLAFTATLGAAAGLVVGISPALQALRTDLTTALSGGSVPSTTARFRVRRWIVIPQIGLSLVLLLVAGVLVRTLIRAEFVDRGIEPQGVLHASFWLRELPGDWTPARRQAETARNLAVRTRVLEKVRQAPAVRAAALTDFRWMGPGQTSVVTRAGFAAGRNHWVGSAVVSSGYFETMGTPILLGRAFDARDTTTSTPVAIVCERLAERLWPGQEPLGQYVAKYDPSYPGAGPKWLQVVGVAREVKQAGFEDRVTFSLYTPLEQDTAWATNIVVRGRATTQELKQAVTAAVAAAETEVQIPNLSTVVEDIDRALYPRRLGTMILALSGLLGLLLSTIGLYGVVSYSAAQRVREVGIRAALGANRRDIVILMLREALLALAIAIACGLALGYAGIRVVSSVVVGLPALDLVTLVAVPALLAVVIVAACLVPARRAARMNPVDVLRGL